MYIATKIYLLYLKPLLTTSGRALLTAACTPHPLSAFPRPPAGRRRPPGSTARRSARRCSGGADPRSSRTASTWAPPHQIEIHCRGCDLLVAEHQQTFPRLDEMIRKTNLGLHSTRIHILNHRSYESWTEVKVTVRNTETGPPSPLRCISGAQVSIIFGGDMYNATFQLNAS